MDHEKQPHRPRRPLWQVLIYTAWVLFSAVLAGVAAIGLIDGIAHSGYDSHENRAPAARIGVAAVALAVALAGTAVAIRHLRGTSGRLGLGAGLALTGAAFLMLFLLALVEIGTGPL